MVSLTKHKKDQLHVLGIPFPAPGRIEGPTATTIGLWMMLKMPSKPCARKPKCEAPEVGSFHIYIILFTVCTYIYIHVSSHHFYHLMVIYSACFMDFHGLLGDQKGCIRQCHWSDQGWVRQKFFFPDWTPQDSQHSQILNYWSSNPGIKIGYIIYIWYIWIIRWLVYIIS